MKEENRMSVLNNIRALALINIEDIFRFTLTAKDCDIEERYGSEENALEVAQKYLDIAQKSTLLNYELEGWSMTYSQPISNSDERKFNTAYFHDVKGEME